MYDLDRNMECAFKLHQPNQGFWRYWETAESYGCENRGNQNDLMVNN